jgi:molybdopterin-containing oxidoreductase family membrane subunit
VPHPSYDDVTRDVLHTLDAPGALYFAWISIAAALLLCFVLGLTWQVFVGLGTTGLRAPQYWALYITDFVFWIGIGHAGTLISAILFLFRARWRTSIFRAAEAMTIFAVMTAGLFPLIHVGRMWFVYFLFPYPNQRGLWPNFKSPLLWDVFAVSTYLSISTVFFIVGLIPDVAALRDVTTGWRRRIYGALALGWQGTPKQWHRLESAMQIMAIAIIPVAVSVHTIVSFDFSMAPVPMWHSTMFGPYFVTGAIFSGIAALILAMAVLRRFLHFEEYLRPLHFENLGKLLLMMSLLWTYFIFSERLTAWYGNEPADVEALLVTQKGAFAPLYWTMVVCNFVVPFVILSLKRLRTIGGCVIASTTVLVGMWLERFLIVVPSLSHKFLPYTWGHYRPRPVEIMITISTFAAMTLLYTIFAKLVPIVSIWELKVGEHPVAAEKAAELREHPLWKANP